MKVWLVWLICCVTVSAQRISVNSDEEIQLLNHNAQVVQTNTFTKVYEIADSLWEKGSRSTHFGLTNEVQWIRFKFNNSDKSKVSKYIYLPYHHVHKIDVYQEVHHQYTSLLKTGTARSSKVKAKMARGYPVLLEFPEGESSIVLRLEHLKLPLRATSYLVSEKSMDTLIRKNQNTIWFWRGVFLLALAFSLVLYLATRLRLFLYYFLLNVGVSLFIGMEVGDFFMFFYEDPYNRIIDIKHLGNILVIFFFPLFLNELTPIKKLHPVLWKFMFMGLWIGPVLWCICLLTPVKSTNFLLYTTYYLIFYTGIVFLLQLFFLLSATLRKEKNSLSLLLLYLLYIAAVTINVIFPNLGMIEDDVLVYNSLLYSSIIEIFTFLLIMGKETLGIYKDRAILLEKQKSYQKEIIKAVVEGQEAERNKVGAELHDMIGGNLAVIKHRIGNHNVLLGKLVDDTIDTVRLLSHGLITPKVDADQFADEIKDLCRLASTTTLTVQYYFHNWSAVKNKNIATHLYRIVQELLQNALKHSNATHVHIQFIKHEHTISFTYEDNGIGFNKDKVTKGQGLLNIKNRVQLIDGRLTLDSSKNSGVFVTLEVPYTVNKL